MEKGEKRITKSGRIYYYYYQKKYPNGKKSNHKLCLERDNYTCQICGATTNLDVHHKDNEGQHIKGNKANEDLINLITLCHRCHIKLHYGVLGKDDNIIALRKNGKTLQQIADYYGVSRQRIHQLEKKYFENNSTLALRDY